MIQIRGNQIASTILVLYAFLLLLDFAAAQPPNFLIIVTDDQRYDSVSGFMPHTQQRIFDEGVVFDHFYIIAGPCCPSRASVFTGLNGSMHGVIQNEVPLVERTIFERLHNAGYFTGLIGKYLNSWDGSARPEFDYWAAFPDGGSRYFDPILNVNGTWSVQNGYITYVLRDRALEFLDQASLQQKPFTLLFAINAPHDPSDPAPGDETLYSGLTTYRPPNFNEADVTDKPLWLQGTPLLNGNPNHGKTCGNLVTQGAVSAIEKSDLQRCKQLQSLWSVDQSINTLMDRLASLGKMDNTVVIFLSDNGYFWGEHRLRFKNRVYEESNRIPFAIRYPPLTGAGGRVEHRLGANVDIAPTLYELAELPIPFATNGRSLVELLQGDHPWRDELLTEGRHDVPPFDGVRTSRYVYAENPGDLSELYDLNMDSYQIQNEIDNPVFASVKSEMAGRLQRLEDHRNTAIWTRSYSGPLNETAEAIQRTLDDGYIVAGTSESLSTTRDGWIAKLDWKGNALWQRLLDGGASVVSIHSISANTNGSYTAAGEIDGDMLVLNLSSDGNIQWQKKYGGSQNDFARSILQTPDGGYIVAGSTNSFNLINQGAWVLKLDINGEIQWQRVLDSPAGIDELHSIIRDWGSYQQGTGLFSGGYLAVGFTSEAGNRDLWVVRLKENGDINWQKRYGGSGDDEGAAILNVWGSDANSVRQYVIVGSTKSYGNGQKDVWVTKIDGNGAILWQKTYGGSNDEEATAIQLTLSQGAIITGGTKSFSAGDEDLFALNLKDDGSLLWQRRYGESGNETARAVDRAYGGGYVIVGSATSFGNGSDDMWILRTDDSGNAGLNCATGTATDAGTTDSTALAINASLTSTVSTAQAELLELTQSPASLSAGNQCGSFILNCQSDYLVASSTQNAAAICTVTSVSGYAGPVLLSCPDLPSGATCSFSPSFVDLSPNGFAATDLTVHVEPVDLENRYTFTIQGTEGAAVRTWIEQLEIQKEISITDPTIWEGNTGTSTMDFDLSLIAPKPGVASVDYFTSDGSATAGTDYTPVSGTLVFEPGETTKRISVIVNGDTIFENDETFFLNLTNPSNVSLDDLVAMAIMKNDEAKPSVTIQDLAVTEPSSGVLNANVIVKLSNAISLPAKVHYATVDNSATAGSDYVSAAGDLTIPAGSTSGNISLVILGDAIAEGAENFKVRLSAPVNSLITDSEAQVTISNKKPAISIQDKKLMEGNSGTTNAVFSVVLSFAYNVNCSANFVTAQSTALAGKDFTAASGTLTIPAGSTTGTIQVPVAGETLYETDETFKVNLSNAVNATFSDSSGLGTIQNDDSIPSLTIDDVSVLEGVAGTANLTFTVSLSAASGLKTTVRFSTAPNTATSGSGDYVQKSGTVTIPAGSLFGTIIIGINGDAILEPNETFFVNLNTPTNATIADSQGIGTIVNDD